MVSDRNIPSYIIRFPEEHRITEIGDAYFVFV